MINYFVKVINNKVNDLKPDSKLFFQIKTHLLLSHQFDKRPKVLLQGITQNKKQNIYI